MSANTGLSVSRSGAASLCVPRITARRQNRLKRKPLVIFCETGKRITQQERLEHDPRVKVQFNPNAWCDGDMFVYWVRHTWRRDVETQKLLVIDSHQAQMTDQAKAITDKDCNTTVVTIGGGLTPVLQPLDLVFNKPFKAKVDDLFNEHLLANLDAYINDTLPAKKGRILMTQWIGQAWAEVSDSMADTVRAVFKSAGISVKQDGSEDDLIRPHGLSDHWYGAAAAPADPRDTNIDIVVSVRRVKSLLYPMVLQSFLKAAVSR